MAGVGSREVLPCPVPHIILVREEDDLGRAREGVQRAQYRLFPYRVGSADDIIEDERTALAFPGEMP